MTDMALDTPAGKGEVASPAKTRRIVLIRLWLLSVAALVLAMVLVGGATRLTDSGLSITEWKPITGAIPPLSAETWEAEFEKYRQIPEYQLVNKGMSLEAFKVIYWWEWGHRFLGRLIGLAFFVPFALFWARGWLTPRLKKQGIALLALGGLQGFVGWYMVSSGLTERVDVSQYRLALHLGLAAVILGALVWVVRDVGLARDRVHGVHSPAAFRVVSMILVVALFLQILLGALVAGLDAGLTYVTWPLMDGAFIPDGLLFQTPWFLNLFENVLTVQFNHRMLAYGIILLALFHIAQALAIRDRAARRRVIVLSAAIVGQAVLGVATLLSMVRIDLALLHQGLAFAILVLAVLHADANQRGLGSAP